MQEKCSKRFFDNFHRFGHFVQKLSKMEKMTEKIFSGQNFVVGRNFWSLDQLVVETLGVAFVRPYVRPFARTYATLFLGNRSLLFSETVQLVRACRCEKNFPSAFLIIFTVLAILAKNCPKWPFLAKNDQNGGFWHFFLEPRIRIS